MNVEIISQIKEGELRNCARNQTGIDPGKTFRVSSKGENPPPKYRFKPNKEEGKKGKPKGYLVEEQQD